MKFDLRRVARATTLAAAGTLAAGGIVLVTSPWNPQVHVHVGVLLVFPGVLLLILSLMVYATGSILSRRGRAGLLAEILVSVIAVVAVATFAFG